MRWLNDSACMTSAVDALWPDAPLGISDGYRRCEISYDRASGRFSGTCTEPEPRRKGKSVYTVDTALLTRALEWGLRMTTHTFGMPVDCVGFNDEDVYCAFQESRYGDWQVVRFTFSGDDGRLLCARWDNQVIGSLYRRGDAFLAIRYRLENAGKGAFVVDLDDGGMYD